MKNQPTAKLNPRDINEKSTDREIKSTRNFIHLRWCGTSGNQRKRQKCFREILDFI